MCRAYQTLGRFPDLAACINMCHHLSSCIITYHQCIILHHPFIFIHDFHSFIISIFMKFSPHIQVCRAPLRGDLRRRSSLGRATKGLALGTRQPWPRVVGCWGGRRFQVTGYFWFNFSDDDFGVKCSWIIFLKFKRSHS